MYFIKLWLNVCYTQKLQIFVCRTRPNSALCSRICFAEIFRSHKSENVFYNWIISSESYLLLYETLESIVVSLDRDVL